MWKFERCLPLLVLTACGGPSAPAETAKPADSAQAPAVKADAAEGKSAAAPDSGNANAGEATKSDKPAAKAADDSPKPTRSAQDILTAPDVVFMFSFNESDVKQTAESKCTASSANDPKKMNQCMAKARKAPGLEVDGYRFKQKDNKWYWLTLRTQGKILHTMHKFEIEFGPEKPGSVTFKPKGKDTGSAPGYAPASVTFDVPNEYQIVFNDPRLGKLVYEAKIGVASD
ncbi:MAG: hypothetical protein ABJB12_12645 [Pseudomonadota bacterium]